MTNLYHFKVASYIKRCGTHMEEGSKMESIFNSCGTATVAGSNLIIISRDILDNILMQLKELNERVATMLQPTSNPQIFTNKSIKELLGIQDKLLKKYRDDGLLPYRQIGDKYWYTREDIEVLLSNSYNEAYAYAS